jgi:hypothetical protein
MVSLEQLESIIARQFGGSVPPPRATEADIESSLHDYLRLAAGQSVREPEPLARAWLRGGSNLSEIRDELRMTSSDFANSLSSAGTTLMRASFASASGDIAAISRNQDVDNYRPSAATLFAFSEPTEAFEGSPLPDGAVSTSIIADGKLREFGMQLGFSRQLFESHGGEITEAIQDHAISFSLIEMRLIAELLESAALDTSASSALALAGLNAVANLLRTQQNAAGAVLNLPLATLLVPPELEMTAHAVIYSLGRPIKVVANAFLTSPTTWFGLTTPTLAAPIRRMRLRNGGLPSLVMDGRRALEGGARFALTHTVNFRLAGRPGIVKAEA